MRPTDVTRMFEFAFTKTSSEIIEKISERIDVINAKIAEREARLLALREDYQIDDGALARLLASTRRADRAAYSGGTYAYSAKGSNGLDEERTIGAGVVNNLLTESDFIENERATVGRLELIKRNIRPTLHYNQDGSSYYNDSFSLTTEELKFLGF